MRELSWSDPEVSEGLRAIGAATPFCYGLTNYVAANLSANVLLAVGASPAIGAMPGAPAAFGAGASAVWINTAALMSSGPDTLTDAAGSAHSAGTPWVLDPVAFGAGAAAYDEIVRSLLAYRPTAIRGNASELIALGGGAGGRGVDSTADSAEAVPVITELAKRAGAVVAVSGPIDYVTDGDTTIAVPGGDPRLTRVTGAGCALGALTAAALAAIDDRLTAVAVAHALYAEAANRARPVRGSGSFAVALVDELSLLAE
ncbi:hydroxyethylthiazole kinase (plasmid) [Pseudonocardia sp. EC080610-09]|uniref:hydroxyethylthiazole kinase n=1 Tax=unclassified Pseudonocardia TaxID=2619320 RepID=UPI0007066C5D|nr:MULTISPECIES: hydroxyethylthiazole kinase [unclassified Pseudonocardia]ALL79452.1 hydroxyethylthiazole kinase [Pseudonocardia sp. EC080610-09]ALL85595.1 hydroxyethylthiazole kinase [Pseudonocardia sp. EC080619-01]